jgi:hypothetical protein
VWRGEGELWRLFRRPAHTASAFIISAQSLELRIFICIFSYIVCLLNLHACSCLYGLHLLKIHAEASPRFTNKLPNPTPQTNQV